MSAIQHDLAHSLLRIIRDKKDPDPPLTYQTAAAALGRPINNARAMAQVCDLLDAAAALAHVPLLALVKVRVASGKINPKAWAKDTPEGVRERIIANSLLHIFTDSDFTAIETALTALNGKGNRAAWAVVMKKIPAEQLFQQMSLQTASTFEAAFEDAVNASLRDDAGTRKMRLSTASRSPTKVSVTTNAFVRNPDVVAEVLLEADGICGRCKKPAPFKRKFPNGRPYLEVHHTTPLAKGGEDTVLNAIALCPNCHRELHYG